jgi:transcription initiation factor TFIIIB Brf1 subunit/transcription initiation factor TFIIB
MLSKLAYLLGKIQWVLQQQKTQVDLANAAQITEVTIRNRFKDLKNRLELHD